MEGASIYLDIILNCTFKKSVIRLFENQLDLSTRPSIRIPFKVNLNYEEKLRKN